MQFNIAITHKSPCILNIEISTTAKNTANICRLLRHCRQIHRSKATFFFKTALFQPSFLLHEPVNIATCTVPYKKEQEN